MGTERRCCCPGCMLLIAATVVWGTTHARLASVATQPCQPGPGQCCGNTHPVWTYAPWQDAVLCAAAAAELQPGDTVLIHSGVYREHVEVKVSGVT